MAPSDATLQVKLLTDIEKSQLEKNLKDVQDMFGKENVNIGTSSSGAAEAKGKAGGGMLSGVTSALQGIGGTLLGIFSVVAIAGIIATQFKQIITMVKIIIKMLIEFLRPIAEMIMVLLTPILVMLKPVIMVFRTLFMPFRQAAMQIAGQAMQSFSEGDIGTGLALSLTAFSTLMTAINALVLKMAADIIGVLMQLVTEILKLLTSPMFLIAQLIGRLIDTFTMGATDVEGKVLAVKDKFNNTLSAAGNFLVATTQNLFGTLLMSQLHGIDTVLQKILPDVGDGLIKLEEFGPVLQGIFDKATINFTNLGAKMEESGNYLDGLGIALDTFFNQLGNDIKKVFEVAKGARDGFFSSGDESMKDMSLWDKIKNGAQLAIEEIKSGGLIQGAKIFGEEVSNMAMQGFNEVKDIVNKMLGQSVIPDLVMSGLNHIYNMVNDGNMKIIASYQTLQNSMNNLASNILSTAKQIDTAASSISSAAAKIASAARSAGSANFGTSISGRIKSGGR